MFAAERRQLIVQRVRAHGMVSLAELATLADSSEATIRRDLGVLAEQGLVIRSRGGAAMPTSSAAASGTAAPAVTVSQQDQAIAELAATSVLSGDTIILGAGTIAQELARRLCERADLTVVTNSILVCTELASAATVHVVMTGGSLPGATQSLVGSEAENSLAGMRVRRAFLSGGGLTPSHGLSTSNMSAASVDRALAAAADEIVVLINGSRVGIDAMFQTVAPSGITHVITGKDADRAVLKSLAGVGVIVDVAGEA
jgi:DeoR/GlpR family transcriptional regulator of sugar metabolism